MGVYEKEKELSEGSGVRSDKESDGKGQRRTLNKQSNSPAKTYRIENTVRVERRERRRGC